MDCKECMFKDVCPYSKADRDFWSDYQKEIKDLDLLELLDEKEDKHKLEIINEKATIIAVGTSVEILMFMLEHIDLIADADDIEFNQIK